ncbi:hypothetical protein DL98DRAFT_601228, partial [Cadophora sp. DSE1049]
YSFNKEHVFLNNSIKVQASSPKKWATNFHDATMTDGEDLKLGPKETSTRILATAVETVKFRYRNDHEDEHRKEDKKIEKKRAQEDAEIRKKRDQEDKEKDARRKDEDEKKREARAAAEKSHLTEIFAKVSDDYVSKPAAEHNRMVQPDNLVDPPRLLVGTPSHDEGTPADQTSSQISNQGSQNSAGSIAGNSQAKGHANDNETAHRSSEEVEEALPTRAPPSPEYNPPGATVQTVDVQPNETVVRYIPTNGADKGKLTFYVLQCHRCALNSSAAVLDKAEVHQYWNNHWQVHNPEENLTKDQVVEKFGVPISNGTLEWLEQHEERQVQQVRSQQTQLREVEDEPRPQSKPANAFREDAKSEIHEGRPRGRSKTRRNTKTMTTTTGKESNSTPKTDGRRPRQSKPSLASPSSKKHQPVRSRTSSAGRMSTFKAPHFDDPEDEITSDGPPSPIRQPTGWHKETARERQDRLERERKQDEKKRDGWLDKLETRKDYRWEDGKR